ncbi:c-type cytochrome [Lysobacter olei]
MPFVTRKSLLTLSILSGVAVVAVAGFVYSGIYNVGADDQHTRPVHALMESLRERSIEVRASKLTLPDLGEQARIVQGSGNYNAMCMGCHLAPGMAATELSKGLYPAPPELTKKAVDPAEAFWVIKHGIKASGMPAWGKSMDDEYIWNMVAFLQKLPTLSEDDYQAMVASSGGHSHGGGETQAHDHGEGVAEDHHEMPTSMAADEPKPHAHPPGTPAHHDKANSAAAEAKKSHAHPPGTPPDHHKPSTPPPESKPAPETVEHRHADGKVESHPAPQPANADDGHDHEH